ncbi:heat-shock protein HtpX [Corynebacterium yudongzhengii]|uniref:Heat-shock protein HtpX n=1 Tax=Corynebacterium yudongzhengii TaxID=2080740 RepID=A0A2U1T834_9CORY|nr:heat-shock protein HtpX [Corynebacterium yudongzhengii]PWC02153.1 heat-shock protein HtpX [Corynebacterium yudongzhengii]
MRDEERSNRRRKILFVCEHNTGRSQIASVIARHHAEDRALIRSVGPDPQPIGNAEIVNQLNERGYDTSLVYPKELTSRTIYESDYVVLIGGDELDGFRDNAAEEWHIDDPETMDADGVSKVIDDIDARVRNLLEQEGVLD